MESSREHAPGHGRRMSVSTRPGEKRSDQSRVTICCAQKAAPEAVSTCGKVYTKSQRVGGVLTDLAADEASEAYGLKVLPRDGGGEMLLIFAPWSDVSQWGMRCSHTGIRSFHGGRKCTGRGGPPPFRFPGEDDAARHAWIWPERVSLAVHDASYDVWPADGPDFGVKESRDGESASDGMAQRVRCMFTYE